MKIGLQGVYNKDFPWATSGYLWKLNLLLMAHVFMGILVIDEFLINYQQD